MKTKLAVALFAFAACLGSAHAEDKPDPANEVSINDTFGKFGFHADTDISPGKCRVVMKLDRGTFIDKMPFMQKIGLMSEDLTPKQIKLKPNSLGLAFLMMMLPETIEQTYKNKDANKCAFTGYMKYPNDYGHMVETEVLSFRFTRSIADKVEWDNVKPINIIKIADGFAYSPVMMMVFAQETKAAAEE